MFGISRYFLLSFCEQDNKNDSIDFREIREMGSPCYEEESFRSFWVVLQILWIVHPIQLHRVSIKRLPTFFTVTRTGVVGF